jgi:flavin reductase (DIM6/NTAB) family NADH-FMN oxidoreductase RutF
VAESEDFDELVGDLDSAMLIVTTADGEEREGCLVGFATATSVRPQRFLVCLSKNNRTFRTASETRRMAVHVVPEDAGELAELFGGETGDDVDKFAHCAWREGPEGLPVIERCPAWFAGRAVETLDAGDHVGFLLEPFAVERAEGVAPFRLRRATAIDPGHEA